MRHVTTIAIAGATLALIVSAYALGVSRGAGGASARAATSSGGLWSVYDRVADVRAFERAQGRIPAGSVVMVRSDWSKRWTTDPAKANALAADPAFPGVSLDALKLLHLRRHILFHGHEPLDTDTTPTLEGEAWLMHHGYAQAEGVANLGAVAPTGCLVSMGFPKLRGGLGGYARYVAICPPSWPRGRRVSGRDAPLPKLPALHYSAGAGYRVR